MTGAFAGKRALVTGASSGVGWELAQRLTAAGAELIMPVRDREKGERVAAALHETAPGARVELRALDLARLDSVRALAAALLAEDRPLDLLVLNAGVVLLGDPVRRISADGFELHFQTNFLGHAALTLGLLPLLRRCAARVAVQGSVVSAVLGVRWDDVQLERRYGALRAYASSKALLGLFAGELAQRVDGIGVALSHPGVVPATAIAPAVRQRVWPPLREAAVRRLGNRPARAAEPALLALERGVPAAEPLCFAPAGWLQLAGPAAERRAPRRLRDAAGAARAWQLAHGLLDLDPA